MGKIGSRVVKLEGWAQAHPRPVPGSFDLAAFTEAELGRYDELSARWDRSGFSDITDAELVEFEDLVRKRDGLPPNPVVTYPYMNHFRYVG